MSNRPRSYRFATAAQWQSGLFHLANRQPGNGLEPLRPYARTSELFASEGASAPALLLTREILWRDDARQLHRLSAAGDVDTFPAPQGVATSQRLAANVHGLWAISNGSLLCYETESMTRLAAVDFPGTRLVDLTFLNCDTLGILAETGAGGWSIRSVGRGGDVLATAPLAGLHHAVACAFLRRSQLLVVLSGGLHPRLSWFSTGGGASTFSLPVSLLFPCCQCHALASGEDDRITSRRPVPASTSS